MSPATIGILGLVACLLLFLVRMPIGFAMALVGAAGSCYLISPKAGFSMLAMDAFETATAYTYTVLPMFVLMGSLAFQTGMGSRLYSSFNKLLGHYNGGLAFAAIAGCAGFGAICGSTTATAAAMGSVTISEMRRYHYDDTLSTGCLAAAGSLGVLIPPSNIFIIYGILTGQSIGKLFISGIVPGIMLSILFCLAIVIVCWRNPQIAPRGPRIPKRERILGMVDGIEFMSVFFLVMGGLFSGFFTPTEAGAAGVASVALVSLIKRELTWRRILDSFSDTARLTGMIMILVIGGMVFGHFLALARLPIMASEWLNSLPFPPWIVLLMIMCMYLIAGCFMDSLAMIILTVPIIYPAILRLGYDPIWFGVLIVLVVEMGVITPPVGVNVYVIKGVAEDVPLEKIFRGIYPFLLALIVNALIIMLFPNIVTFLPNLIG